MTPRTVGRPPVTRPRIVDTAIRLADGGGLGAVTMRAVAAELGVEAMSLYHHVANKEDLVVAMLDHVVGEIAHPGDGPWRPELRATAISANEVLLRHGWATSLLLAGAGVSTARLRQMDAVLGCLTRAGFPPALHDRAYHALDSHILGFTMWQVTIRSGLAAIRGSLREFIGSLPLAELPHLAAHIDHHLAPPPSDEGDGDFAFGLDLLLDGLERALAAATDPG